MIAEECGTQLEWKGNIKCDCGQEFYYETNRLVINCIRCGKEHSVV